ncbi:NADPH:adrenodoxin oxidoreductase, mitochondrial isoform X3 [Canna indica]|uniref:NADPH:adrenodoxin oxidoreductase, mitochondrial isoform X3 n=1 Tax=Canna indica TaxID=4628 RepID=A0AAQ3KL53_9LILI|nr:NADPH:adrenodoxin oxidoreductase, mitochondrial isoform X3 [Canna indica]
MLQLSEEDDEATSKLAELAFRNTPKLEQVELQQSDVGAMQGDGSAAFFQEMSELVNQKCSVQEEVPSGDFNALFGISGSWMDILFPCTICTLKLLICFSMRLKGQCHLSGILSLLARQILIDIAFSIVDTLAPMQGNRNKSHYIASLWLWKEYPCPSLYKVVLDHHYVGIVCAGMKDEELKTSKIQRRVYDLLCKSATFHQQLDSAGQRELHFIFFKKPDRFLPSEDNLRVGSVHIEKTCLKGVVPNVKGRVVSSNQKQQAEMEQGLYVVGWLKRGPTGIVATNLYCAEETVTSDFGGTEIILAFIWPIN